MFEEGTDEERKEILRLISGTSKEDLILMKDIIKKNYEPIMNRQVKTNKDQNSKVEQVMDTLVSSTPKLELT